MFKSSDFLKSEIDNVQKGLPLTTDIGNFANEINAFLKKISSSGTEKSDSQADVKAPVNTSIAKDMPTDLTNSSTVMADDANSSVLTKSSTTMVDNDSNDGTSDQAGSHSDQTSSKSDQTSSETSDRQTSSKTANSVANNLNSTSDNDPQAFVGITDEKTEIAENSESHQKGINKTFDTHNIAEPINSSATKPIHTFDNYPFEVCITFDEDAQMENLRAFMLTNIVAEGCPDIKIYPDVTQSDATNPAQPNTSFVNYITQNGFYIYFHNLSDFNISKKSIENFVYIKTYTAIDFTPKLNEHQIIHNDSSSDAHPVQEHQASNVSPKIAPQNAAPSTSLINVNLNKLDSLMNLMGEIVITESMVTSIPTSGNIDLDNFTKASRQLRKLTDELQEIVMSIRMVPVSGVFQKMRRIIRDMSKQLNKDVELILIGEDTEVDKTIVDSISDPIMHLVRNAMDHGIESSPEDRVAQGKSEKGHITLSAENTGGEILVTVQDDGKGFAQEAILKKAKRQNLLKKPESEYTQKEIFQLLFLPGFSTNEQVTEFSGRGVGMDVVKKNVEKVGGEVMLESEVGRGSVITFKIPLTLAIIAGMEISVGKSLFTVPITNIKLSLKGNASNILYDTEMNEIFMTRDKYYPLIRLHKIFDIETEITDIESGIVIQIESGDKSFCIFADTLIEEQQVVIKPLPNYLSKYRLKEYGVAGCAILGDGNISLILDAEKLINNV